MKQFIFGFVFAVAAIAGGVLLYFGLGFAPVGTATPPMPFERSLARMALHAKIARQPLAQPPIPADAAGLTAGAQIYREHCAVCHGLRGQPETAIAKGMFPPPPQLFQGHGVTDDAAGETYWKVANGIRLTGMPGFEKSLTDTQLWQVSLMLADADKLPPAAMALLSQPPAGK
ncbi:MAG TPA: c-type cytochrome [Bryobacteraceae bacterium]|nr:c-type cytochrome [Bryobacteraceae bacterium]